MSITVMIANDSEADEAALRYALDLSVRLDVSLDVISAMPDPSTAYVFSASEFAVGAGAITITRVREAQDKTIEAITTMFERVRDELSIPAERASYRHDVAPPETAAGRAAILSDGIVFPRDCGRGEHALTAAFEHVLIDRRLPVLLFGPSEQKSGPVIIAWDGSAEAARAVMLHEALICKHAQAIIAQNPDDLKPANAGEASSASRLIKWLTARDVSTEICTFSGKVADGLIRIAEQNDADLIVAGAYGHSRMGEFLFGGASRSLLRAKEGPALALAH